jgi:hypothetical protein
MTSDEVRVLPVMNFEEAASLVAGDWMSAGACTATDAPDLAEASDEQMKALCSVCPVRPECLSYATLIGAAHYVFGGLTPTERRELDNGQRYSTCAAPDCGRAFLWVRVGNTQPPGVCETCNGTERLALSYSYGGRP